MAKIKTTGSAAHRVWKCPASAVLPQVPSDRSKYEPARDKGKAIHSFLERVKLIGRPAALAEAPKELLPMLEALDLENLPVSLATEVAFAWNWRTSAARELGRNLGRAYERADPPIDWGSEIPCTLDVVGVQEFDSIQGDEDEHGDLWTPPSKGYVGDYKSGHTKYPAPDLFAQTLLGGACVRSVYGCDDVVLELITIHDNGGHHAVRRTVDEWELDIFERELAAAMLEVEHWEAEYARTGTVAAHEGPWCDWCDAYKSCPSKVALVREIPERLMVLGVRPDPESGALVLTPGVISVRNASDAWMMAERIADVVNRIKEEICSIGAFEPIPLPDGRVIGHLHTERRSVNGRLAAELLEKRYGREERDKRVELSVTMASLRLAVVSNLKQGEKIETKAKTGEFDRLLEELERLGGIEVNTTDAVKPHVPKRKRLGSG